MVQLYPSSKVDKEVLSGEQSQKLFESLGKSHPQGVIHLEAVLNLRGGLKKKKLG